MRFEKNAEQGQSSVSVVVTETTALSPVKPPNSNSILWIVDITPAGTLCFFSRDVKKAALEAFFFRLLGGGGGRTARQHKFPKIYLNDFEDIFIRFLVAVLCDCSCRKSCAGMGRDCNGG